VILTVDRDPRDKTLIAIYYSAQDDEADTDELDPSRREETTLEIYATATGRPVFEEDSYIGTATCPPHAWHLWLAAP